MGPVNKLLATVHGVPVIVRSLAAMVEADLEPVVVVTGHMRQEVEAVVDGARTVYNPRHREGMGTSVASGVSALPEDIDGFLIALGDMPWVLPDTIRALIARLAQAGPDAICVPTHGGARGNPVLFGRERRAALTRITGDRGARDLVGASPSDVAEVPVTDDGILRDIDTVEALAAVDLTQKKNS